MPNFTSSSINACKLPRGVIRIIGEDRSSFLQGLISNDLALCVPNNPLYAALLTPQGKFLHEFFIYQVDDAFLLDCELARADDLLQRLERYVLRAKVMLTDASPQYNVWAFLGLEKHPEIATDPRWPALGARGILAKSTTPEGYTITETKTYDAHRLALGVADGSRDMVVSSSTLLDANFDLLNGISWTKGCYIGQELTARMHHRALIKKRMFPVTISGAAPTAGSPVLYKGVEIGEMRSSCDDVGLALLNIDALKKAMEAGDALDCAVARLTPHWPEWMSV